MNPGIFYLYEYKNNQLLRNAGFLKLTCHHHSCEVQLRSRGIPVSRQDSLTLSILWQDKENIYSRSLAKIPCETHSFSARLTFSESDLPTPVSINLIDGFLILLPNENCLVAAIPGNVLDIQKIKEYKEPISTPGTTSEIISAELHLPEDTSDTIQELKDTSDTLPEPEDAPDTPPEPEDAPDTPPEPEDAPVSDSMTEDNQNLTSRRTIRKIQRSELSLLPRKCWYLSNNSFLLHGYYNYNHLLLVEENGHFWLGVPGIYDSREARAAELFGFPQFNDAYNKQLDLSEDEYNPHGKFGYWFHYIY